MPEQWRNKLFFGDNLDIMRKHITDGKEIQYSRIGADQMYKKAKRKHENTQLGWLINLKNN